MQLKKIQMSILSASLTALMCSSVVQASDLQIYAMPTAGKKTIIMMVDVSGSMAYKMSENANPSWNEKSRIDELKSGLKAVLDSTDPKLENIVMGLGKYPGDGNSKSSDAQYMRGKILVEAKALGASTKTNGIFDSQHRRDLLAAVNALQAVGGTPTAHGLAEAASYLMGTKTNHINITISVPTYNEKYRNQTSQKECKRYSTVLSSRVSTNRPPSSSGQVKGTTYYYYACDEWNTTNISVASSDWDVRFNDNENRRFYKKTGNNAPLEITDNTSDNSGFSSSVSDSKITTDGIEHYKSPLPTNKVTCDGQGVYVLSDGEPNASSDAAAEKQMINALANPLANSRAPSFSCATGSFDNPLTGGNSGGAWQCMGEFAKRLYSGENPASVKIQTAFVGYSDSFTNLSAADVQNACKLGSRKVGDRCSYYTDDQLTINESSVEVTEGKKTKTVLLRAPEGGYGNGGFYTANSANDVTTSVLNFIDNLGTDPLAPIPTGALSVPVDALNPNGLQNVGYLRMLEPNPAQPSLLTWVGNLKKYSMKDGVLVDGAKTIFDAQGEFATNTKNLWGALSEDDGGKIKLGGTYEKLPMPTLTQQGTLRNLMTDVVSVTGTGSSATLQPLQRSVDAKGNLTSTLLKLPVLANTTTKEEVLNKFRTQAVLKDFPLKIKLKLLNYLGFKVDTALAAFPNDGEVSYEGTPYISMGGIIHSFPVQMTYSGVLSESGDLLPQDIQLEDGKFIRARKQSVLYGSMEGGLHLIDSLTGEEQMVFVPAEILNDERASNALVPKGSGTPAPAHGVDSPWIVDATYRTAGEYPEAQVIASEMNVYGGLRMGGSSYYALDVLTPTAPKLKFRIGADQANFSRMGQSWSKPVLINIRKDGKPKRAMVIGGGYDECYEEPRFKLSSSNTPSDDASCTGKARAKGNAIYVIDADTGERLFWASNTGSDANNADLKHSVVSRISALDRDGDGFDDHLYFGDLGGQIFRIDLDNYHEKTQKTFGVRTVRLANLATTTDGSQILNGDNPRFYEPVTLTIHDEQDETFIHVGAASGDRSTPLDVAPVIGRDGLAPSTALSNRPVNKVYGVFDLDFIKKDLISNRSLSGNYSPTTSETDLPLAQRLLTYNLTLKNLLANPQTSLTGNSTAYSQYFNSTAPKMGWYRSLSWSWDYQVDRTGRELANGEFRQPGGLKAYEEPQAIGNNLFLSVYDPEGTGITPQDECLPRVVGETDRQQYCLPFGVCVTKAGVVDETREHKTGFRVKFDSSSNHYNNTNVIGKGIQGISLANNGGAAGGGKNICGNFTLSSNTAGIGNWQCTRTLNPTRWFEKR